MGLVPMKELEIGDEFIYAGRRFQKTSDLGLWAGVLNCCNMNSGEEYHLSPYAKVVPV